MKVLVQYIKFDIFRSSVTNTVKSFFFLFNVPVIGLCDPTRANNGLALCQLSRKKSQPMGEK